MLPCIDKKRDDGLFAKRLGGLRKSPTLAWRHSMYSTKKTPQHFDRVCCLPEAAVGEVAVVEAAAALGGAAALGDAAAAEVASALGAAEAAEATVAVRMSA